MPSIMQRIGTPNNRHNKDEKYRATLENVDPELTKYNEVLREKTVEAIYAEHLQPGFDAFNVRQKRKDRRLDVKWECSTYLEYQRKLDEKARGSKNAIDQKGRPPIREIVWQIGNPEQGYGSANQTDESREWIKGMLLECQAEAELRYPQLIWGDLLFHADEVSKDADDLEHGSLHLHSSFVPLCYQNKQGADVQVAFERCLKEMGFDTFQEWKHDLDDLMEMVLHRHGLERTFMDNHEKHQTSKEFHRQQVIRRQTKELKAELDAYERMTQTAQDLAKSAEERVEEANRRADAAREAQELEEQKRDSLAKENDELYNKGKTLHKGLRDMAELKSLAEYQTQVIDNDKAIEKLDSGIQNIVSESLKEGLSFASVRRIVKSVIDSLSDFIEKLKVNISRIKLYENLYPKQFREGGSRLNGERQERRLNAALSFDDQLSDAQQRSEETISGASDIPEKNFDK